MNNKHKVKICSVHVQFTGAPNDSKIFVRRSKNCLEFSITWRRLEISRELFHSCKIFEPYLLSSLRFLIFSFYFPIWAIFLRKKKGNLKFSDSKMWWREESVNVSPTFVIRQISSKNFRENKTQGVEISKRCKFP